MSRHAVGVARITALIPAHNEEALISAAIRGLLDQSRIPHKIIVVADNCTDGTVSAVEAMGEPRVFVFETAGNTDKKAGALNQALGVVLPGLDDDDVVLVQDADSILNSDFVGNAAVHLDSDRGLGAVGGTFRAVPSAGDASLMTRFLVHLQDNEYARYARDVRRLKGKCLVVTGTAALFRASTLRKISAARVAGTLPSGNGAGGVYDTTVLTEDNELSFAVMTMGMRILAPSDCLLVTDAMTTWKELWAQRLRWKRGAVENCVQYGFTSVTASYWGRQALSIAGVLVTAAYLGSLVWSLIFTGGIVVQPFWLAVTGIFVLERGITLKDKGTGRRLLAATMYELPYDLFLQVIHARAYLDSVFKTKKVW
ncbi:glycosyltransferase family 2 protein [Arthrobacter sp. ISL-72]|uniref:glycosyltransferase family 2 protein n=1 Tax=Arthrobacter sp. ISL-72 TaxID=2819114 RepID=UPI001BE65C5A|nr:glycosyltransferase family 2 protein [Arthrobacter sp. ISL-72]MBT2594822.1 glycosyltransferase [Arthrobacter sp. ISL-72]